jgi:hypothetical protein
MTQERLQDEAEIEAEVYADTVGTDENIELFLDLLARRARIPPCQIQNQVVFCQGCGSPIDVCLSHGLCS